MLYDVALPFTALAPAAEPRSPVSIGTSQWSLGNRKADVKNGERVA